LAWWQRGWTSGCGVVMAEAVAERPLEGATEEGGGGERRRSEGEGSG